MRLWFSSASFKKNRLMIALLKKKDPVVETGTTLVLDSSTSAGSGN